MILVIVGYTIFNGSESAPKQVLAAYITTTQNARKEKDGTSKQERRSPIEDKATFKGLPYLQNRPYLEGFGRKIDKVESGPFEIQMTGGEENETYEPYRKRQFWKEEKDFVENIYQ